MPQDGTQMYVADFNLAYDTTGDALPINLLPVVFDSSNPQHLAWFKAGMMFMDAQSCKDFIVQWNGLAQQSKVATDQAVAVSINASPTISPMTLP